MLKNYSLLILIGIAVFACTNPVKTQQSNDQLSLSNEGEVKTAFLGFVSKVTDAHSPDFVKAEDRITTFDNNGTPWCEKPLYIPIELELVYVKSEYSHRPLKEMTCAPMVQWVHYLQKNNFKVYIVTGGEITSVRTVSEEIYNIPKENVVGSSVLLEYVSDDSGPCLVRTAKINSANDKEVKPANIELHFGRKPIFAAGNSDGDYQMMIYTLSGDGPSMAFLVHYDDETREYGYMHGIENAVFDAAVKGWDVVSMKNDFSKIFAV